MNYFTEFVRKFNERFGLIGNSEKLKKTSVNQWLRKTGKVEDELGKIINIIDSENLVHGCLRATDTFDHLGKALDGNN